MLPKGCRYLGTNVMRATSSTMTLASTVLGFDVIELWAESLDDGIMRCTYVYATDAMKKKYPDLIFGHYPEQKKEHKLSPSLCEQARKSSDKYYWYLSEDTLKDGKVGNNKSAAPLASTNPLYFQISAPFKTEIAYLLENGLTAGVRVYIVAFAIDQIKYRPSKLKFLAGLGYAVYVAAFELEEEDELQGDLTMKGLADTKELDEKGLFIPRPLNTPHSSTNNLVTFGQQQQPISPMSMSGLVIPSPSRVNLPPLIELAGENNIGVSPAPKTELTQSQKDGSSGGYAFTSLPASRKQQQIDSKNAAFEESLKSAVAGAAVGTVVVMSSSASSSDNISGNNTNNTNTNDTTSSAVTAGAAVTWKGVQNMKLQESYNNNNTNNSNINTNSNNSGSSNTLLAPMPLTSVSFVRNASMHSDLGSSVSLAPPTWEPVDTFSFPIANIPIKSFVPDNLTFHSFEEMKHIADGSNSNIFLGKFMGAKVIVKMIKEDVQNNPIAIHEFDIEHGMLSRFSHPHVIKLLGAGLMPRRFIVIEFLGGGSLSTLLVNNQEKPGIAQRFFRRPTFTYLNLLSRIRDMADALDYLHSRCQVGAIVIHRDLKPDNVGFTSDGTLKLFDFGLCTCIKASQKYDDEVYDMTGNTGSLRYMAPEVAMRKSYNEKVDVYSYGIMVWQMARDRVPFKGLSKIEFFSTVVNGDVRPTLDKSWPTRFSQLLQLCWHRDYKKRPSFREIVAELDKLFIDAGGKSSTSNTPPSTPPLPLNTEHYYTNNTAPNSNNNNNNSSRSGRLSGMASNSQKNSRGTPSPALTSQTPPLPNATSINSNIGGTGNNGGVGSSEKKQLQQPAPGVRKSSWF